MGAARRRTAQFIRFSLRDALARASARVMDLLREWDEDASGSIDRKEFRRAINTLGFGALADKDDVDMVFDEFDESGDGLIQFNELNRSVSRCPPSSEPFASCAALMVAASV